MTGQSCTTSLSNTRKTHDTFTWTIKNIFSGEYALEDRVLSNEFIVKGTDGRETKWLMEWMPNATGDSLSGRDDKHFKVLIHNKNEEPMKTALKVSFLDGKQAEKETVSHFKRIQEYSSFELCKHSWKSASEKGLTNWCGNLTIKCEITIYSSTTSYSSVGPEGSQSSKSKCSSSLLKKAMKTFSKSFGQFYLSKEMSDVQIQCEDQTFDAHQIILSAGSPGFRAMF